MWRSSCKAANRSDRPVDSMTTTTLLLFRLAKAHNHLCLFSSSLTIATHIRACCGWVFLHMPRWKVLPAINPPAWLLLSLFIIVCRTRQSTLRPCKSWARTLGSESTCHLACCRAPMSASCWSDAPPRTRQSIPLRWPCKSPTRA